MPTTLRIFPEFSTFILEKFNANTKGKRIHLCIDKTNLPN